MGMTGLIGLKWTPADQDLYRTVYAVVMILANQCFQINNLQASSRTALNPDNLYFYWGSSFAVKPPGTLDDQSMS
jgi:hypothetical protein